jgi:hypothetical protein
MLKFKSLIKDSLIPMAGKGLFTQEFLKRGKVIIFPNQEHKVFTASEFKDFDTQSIEHISGIRWFEDCYSCDPEWSEESHLNHSFEPNCLWHLGFVFPIRDILAGEELTINYRYLLDEDSRMDFVDSVTGKEIRGLKFSEKMNETSSIIAKIFSN